jgi:hypothetical protein
MTELEDRVRQAFRSHEHDVDDGWDGVTLVRSGLQRRRRRTLAGVALGLTVALTGGLVATVSLSDGAETLTSLDEVPRVPAGSQAVSFHGIQILVPAGWQLNATRCGTPMHDTVLIMDGSPAEGCLAEEPPGLTVARLDLLSTEDGRALDRLATAPVTVDAHPARRGQGSALSSSTPVEVLSVPDVGVVVSVRSPAAKSRGAIISSASVVPLDSFGCRDRVDRLTPTTTPDRPGAHRDLVPGQPVTAALCRYADNWQARSVAVPVTEIAELATVFNRLSETAPPTSWPPACPAEEYQRGFIVRFGYGDGSTLDVVARVGTCEPIVSNGSRWTGISAALVDFLTHRGGYDGLLDDPSTLPAG